MKFYQHYEKKKATKYFLLDLYVCVPGIYLIGGIVFLACNSPIVMLSTALTGKTRKVTRIKKLNN